MVIECPQCAAKYQYSEERFDGKPNKKIRCSKCQTVFDVKNPAIVAPAAAAHTVAPPEDGFDSTVARRGSGMGAFVAQPENSTAQAGIPSPRDTGKVEDGPRLSGDRRYSLAILDGPDAGKVFRIERPKTVIGRSAGDLILNDIEASRSHACVEVRDPVVLLSDMESTNGTLVGGEKITGAVELYNHAEFQVGTTTIMLIVTDAD
ncbi:MAG: zinc-ribbon domain-containing protein [Thermoanaerobaculia bacterium]|nr:zinc-ribbon domain-containing protein [Thermoanaerobaculia bacterium]